MGFIMEFVENLILRTMEDPKERIGDSGSISTRFKTSAIRPRRLAAPLGDETRMINSLIPPTSTELNSSFLAAAAGDSNPSGGYIGRPEKHPCHPAPFSFVLYFPLPAPNCVEVKW